MARIGYFGNPFGTVQVIVCVMPGFREQIPDTNEIVGHRGSNGYVALHILSLFRHFAVPTLLARSDHLGPASRYRRRYFRSARADLRRFERGKPCRCPEADVPIARRPRPPQKATSKSRAAYARVNPFTTRVANSRAVWCSALAPPDRPGHAGGHAISDALSRRVHLVQKGATKLRHDSNVMRSVIRAPSSNEPTERRTNRLKMLKRTMYRRVGVASLHATMCALREVECKQICARAVLAATQHWLCRSRPELSRPRGHRDALDIPIIEVSQTGITSRDKRA